MQIVVSDTFTRADNGSTLGSTETGTAGALPWSVLGTGVYGIASNQAYPVAPVANDLIVVDSGVAAATVSILMTGGVTYTGIVFRVTNALNYWRVYLDGASVNLEKVVAGVPTGMGSAALPVGGDTLGVVFSGNSITIQKTGATIIGPVTDSFNATATKHGLYLAAGSAAVRWDNFLVTIPTAATKLGILRHALGSASGLTTSNREFDFQPAILIQDVNGATVTTDNTTVVTATITSGAGVLIGTVTKTATAGVADFGANSGAGMVYASNALGINGVGTNTITYSASGLTSVVDDPITTAAGSFVGTGTNPAELPRGATPTRTQLTIDGTTYLETAATIQARINAIQAAGGNLNHEIQIADGQDVTVQVTVPARASGGTGWLQIRSQTLPCAFGTLARPSMFTTQATWSTPDNRAIIVAADAGFVNLRLVGLNIRIPATNMVTKVDRLVQFWNDVGNTLAAQTRGFKMERCWLHGKVGTGEVGRALDLMGRDGAVFNCWFQDLAGWGGGQEAQCILMGGGAGPYLIEDNYFEAAGELVLSGGFDQGTPGLIPSDVTVRRNHFNCPRAKYQFQAVVAKHLLETKTARRWLIEGNVFENMWVGQETGPALLLNSINQSGGAPWNGSVDLIVRKNFCRNAEAFVTIGGGTGVQPNRPTARLVFNNNVAPNISMEPNPAYVGAQRFFLLLGPDVEVTHNTLLEGVNGCRIATYTSANSTPRHIFRDNIASGTQYGVVADGTLGGPAITFAAPGAVWHHNTLINFYGGDSVAIASMASSGYTPNYFVPTNTSLGLTNAAITATWATADPDAVCAALVLAPGSPYRAGGATPASDGLDIGADIAAVRAAISGVWTGTAGGGGVADHLSVVTQPSTPIVSGTAHVIQPVVAVRDITNATATSDTSTVTAALVVETGIATPIGLLTKAAVAGVADFAANGLGATSLLGATAHWHFTDGALIAVDSAVFTITAPPATYAASPTRVVPATFAIKQGDTAPPLIRTLTGADGVPQDLTGATVRFSMRLLNGPVLVNRASCTIVDAPAGKVQYTWQTADTLQKGTCLAEFEVTLPGGSIITFPDDGYHVVMITPQIA